MGIALAYTLTLISSKVLLYYLDAKAFRITDYIFYLNNFIDIYSVK